MAWKQETLFRRIYFCTKILDNLRVRNKRHYMYYKILDFETYVIFSVNNMVTHFKIVYDLKSWHINVPCIVSISIKT